MGLQQIPSKGGIPSGNTASRPGSPVIGDTYYDGTLGFLLIFDGTAFIPCSAPAAQPSIAVTDVGTGVAYGTVQGSVAFTEGPAGGKAGGFTATQSTFSTTGTSSPLVVTITGNPGSYLFAGTAYNGFGTSPSSTSVAQTLTSVPQAPTIGTATPSGSANEVTVTWTLGANGGKNLSAITITPYLNGTTAETARTAATTSSTSYTFTTGQLTLGASYTFKVKATNANGTGLESAASNSATMPDLLFIDYLVVAGGGGGGRYQAGGGGAGGLRSSVTATGGGGTLESATGVALSTNYSVIVGAAGNFNSGGQGGTGGNSTFSVITSLGGGGGGFGNGASNTAGNSGGSGGGGYAGNNNAGGAGTANQGFAGGAGAGAAGGGGGGGAGEAGNTDGQAYGGDGVAVAITGSSVFYAGGGSGGRDNSATVPGGQGGGGTGGQNSGTMATAGTTNTGGGGGGGATSPDYEGANGGSGVVILRWLTSSASITVGAGLTADSTGTDGSYSYKRFTAGSGNVSFA
jgi:hypothetical protein